MNELCCVEFRGDLADMAAGLFSTSYHLSGTSKYG